MPQRELCEAVVQQKGAFVPVALIIGLAGLWIAALAFVTTSPQVALALTFHAGPMMHFGFLYLFALAEGLVCGAVLGRSGVLWGLVLPTAHEAFTVALFGGRWRVEGAEYLVMLVSAAIASYTAYRIRVVWQRRPFVKI